MDAVLTLAGEGTRMLPWSRGLRKEFLPLYDRGEDGSLVLKPVAHVVVESLVESGARRLTVVVQPRDATFVENYFSVDPGFLRRQGRRHPSRLAETRRFYGLLGKVRFRFVRQPTPAGFGDAVLRARARVGPRPFLLHAGDGVVLERRKGSVLRAMDHLRESEGLDGVLLVRRVADPRRYGVVEGLPGRAVNGFRRLEVRAMVEKPARPRGHWAATAVYAFGPRLFAALDAVRRRDHPEELEVTDGVREMLRTGGRVAALILPAGDGVWRSVGSPAGYARTLALTRRMAGGGVRGRRND